MHSRQNSKRANTGQFGLSFVDGEKLHRRIQKANSVELWATPTSNPSLERVSIASAAEKVHFKPRVEPISLQKFGAAKITIPGDINKPIFLKKLTQFLYDELRLLGAQNEPPGSTKRLQAYVEAFNIFIREFKYYEPILDGIKQEYETMIENQRNDLSQYEVVKSKLSVMEFRMAQEIEKAKTEFRGIIQEMHEHANELSRQIDMKNYENHQLQNRYDTLVAEQKRVIEQKPTETPELQELRALALEYADYEKKTRDLLDVKEQQVVELLAYKKKAQAELVEATASYGKLKQRLAGMSMESARDLQKKLEKTTEKAKQLEDYLKETKKQYEESERQLKEVRYQLQKSMELHTPDWEYIQSQFSSSVREYFTRAKALDYNDTIVLLIQELNRLKSTGSVHPEATDSPNEQTSVHESNSVKTGDQYFTGKGIGNNVPKYLRTKSKILNRRLTKSQTLLLLRDVWQAKLLYEATNPKTGLGDFLFMYLKKRFGNQEHICEWGYNLVDALQRHRETSVDCAMFSDILNGKMEESIYSNLRDIVTKLHDEFCKMDMQVHYGHIKGYLDKSESSKLLATFFKDRNKKQISALEDALVLDQPGISIIYKFIFESEGDSVFIEMVKQLEVERRQEYIKDIEDALRKLSRDETVSVFEATRMLQDKEPSKTMEEIEEYISRGFNCDISALKPKMLISKKEFLTNLQRGPLIRGSIHN